ncbi:MAG: hypothetical protein LBF88_09805 [Planctomycetaceae bacterium]|jgi:hypothetical protein|nr:hypothetical protein [Planctomycetaceae bacterium]
MFQHRAFRQSPWNRDRRFSVYNIPAERYYLDSNNTSDSNNHKATLLFLLRDLPSRYKTGKATIQETGYENSVSFRGSKTRLIPAEVQHFS